MTHLLKQLRKLIELSCLKLTLSHWPQLATDDIILTNCIYILYFQGVTSYTKEYRTAKHASQIVGWIVAFVCGVIPFVFLAIHHSYSSMTHDQQSFSSAIKEDVEKVFQSKFLEYVAMEVC